MIIGFLLYRYPRRIHRYFSVPPSSAYCHLEVEIWTQVWRFVAPTMTHFSIRFGLLQLALLAKRNWLTISPHYSYLVSESESCGVHLRCFWDWARHHQNAFLFITSCGHHTSTFIRSVTARRTNITSVYTYDTKQSLETSFLCQGWSQYSAIDNSLIAPLASARRKWPMVWGWRLSEGTAEQKRIWLRRRKEGRWLLLWWTAGWKILWRREAIWRVRRSRERRCKLFIRVRHALYLWW